MPGKDDAKKKRWHSAQSRPGEMQSVHANSNFVTHRAGNFTVETPQISARLLVDTFP